MKGTAILRWHIHKIKLFLDTPPSEVVETSLEAIDVYVSGVQLWSTQLWICTSNICSDNNTKGNVQIL